MQTPGESKPDSGSGQAAEHVKKQEQPQTHEDLEAQKLVERIEKKVSAQRKTGSVKTPAKPPQQEENNKQPGTQPAEESRRTQVKSVLK